VRATIAVVVAAVTFAAGCGKKQDGHRPVIAAAVHDAGAAKPNPFVARGKNLYGELCALCHGEHGEGYKADNAPSLVNPTFLASVPPAFLRNSIVRGRPGTAMAGYGRIVGGPLDDGAVDAVMAYLRQGAPHRVATPPPGRGDVGHGKALYETNCQSCHGTPAKRGEAVHLGNGAFLAASNPGFLRYAIVEGRPGTKMEPWKGKLDDGQIADVVAYIESWPHVVPPNPNEVTVPKGPIVINPKGKAPEFSPLKEGRYVPAAEVKHALDQGRRLVIADARPPSDWLRVHIPGAISIPYYDMRGIAALPKDDTWIVAYCACPHHASGIVMDELRKQGFKHTAVIDEGILGWQRAGYPAVTADGKPAPMPPGLGPIAPGMAPTPAGRPALSQHKARPAPAGRPKL